MRQTSPTANITIMGARVRQALGSGWRASTIAAWSICVACLALLIGTIALIALSASALAGAGSLLPAYTYVTHGTGLLLLDIIGYGLELAAPIAFATIGAFIATRYPAHPVGWILSALGLLGIGEEFATQYAIYGLIARPGALPGSLLAAWVTEWTWTIFAGLLNVWLPFLFPTGRPLSRRWRPVGWFAASACALLTLGFMLKPGPFGNRTLLAAFTSPIALIASDSPLVSIIPLIFGAMLASMLLAVVSLLLRLRHARGEERQQIKWFCYPTALLALLFVLQGIVQHILGIWSPALSIAYRSLWALIFAALPIAIGIAILKYRLYGIDVVINRTLVYGALTSAISGIYIVVVGTVGAAVQSRGNLLVALFGAGLVAVLFQPLRERFQRGVNHLLYGERDDPYAALARLGRRLEATLAPDTVLPTIVESVRDALKLPYVAIALDEDGACATAAAVGVPGGDTESLPLVHQGETIGQLILAPRTPGENFSPNDRRLLSDLARQVGIAAHTVRLTADLQRSRERLVAAREEERRRLRRDLHDGLGPSLATQTLKLEAARDLLFTNPHRSAALLGDLISGSQTAIADIRRLVYALRPPALDELGLDGAIRELAAQYGQTGVQISIDAPEHVSALPAAVEVAAYRIAQEALTNVVRHAAARECHIRLMIDAAALELEVCDDGRGLPVERRAGVGVASMRERAAELGGTCTIEPAPDGGTCVAASLPLP